MLAAGLKASLEDVVDDASSSSSLSSEEDDSSDDNDNDNAEYVNPTSHDSSDEDDARSRLERAAKKRKTRDEGERYIGKDDDASATGVALPASPDGDG